MIFWYSPETGSALRQIYSHFVCSGQAAMVQAAKPTDSLRCIYGQCCGCLAGGNSTWLHSEPAMIWNVVTVVKLYSIAVNCFASTMLVVFPLLLVFCGAKQELSVDVVGVWAVDKAKRKLESTRISAQVPAEELRTRLAPECAAF